MIKQYNNMINRKIRAAYSFQNVILTFNILHLQHSI